jgi:GDPmannose 4,6-dehydratase
MWLILQQEKPEDYVIATGVTTAVRDFVDKAFRQLGIILAFEGDGNEEIARVEQCLDPNYLIEPGKVVLAVDPAYFRPTEVELLIGDPDKAKTKLGWTPTFTLDDLVKDMVESDLKAVIREKVLMDNGIEVVFNSEF